MPCLVCGHRKPVHVYGKGLCIAKDCKCRKFKEADSEWL